MNYFIKQFAVLLCILFASGLSAQTIERKVINTTGGLLAPIGGPQLHHNVGETFSSTLSAGGYMLTQGFIQPLVASVPPITGTLNVCAGSSTTLGNTASGGSWSSSNTTVATIGSTGIVSGLVAGTSTISYTVGGSSVTAVVTVNAAPLPIAGATNTCVGNMATLTNSTTGGTWSSSNTSIVSINSTGEYTGITAGTAMVTYNIGSCQSSVVITILENPSRIVGPGSNNIINVAGNGMVAFSGDGGLATSAALKFPLSACMDMNGNMFIADNNNSRIRKVSPSGIISTIAGTGTNGYNGDGISATAAQLNQVSSVAVDASGNVYVADQSNHRIRKISTTGIISTFAGTGTSGYSGEGGAATASNIASPSTIVFDAAGNLFIASSSSGRLLKVSPSGILTTYAGNGTGMSSIVSGSVATASPAAPYSVAVDNIGNVYITEQSGSRVRKINTSGIITILSGTGTAGYSGDGGAATDAMLNNPSGIAVDAVGNVYINDVSNYRIRKINTSGVISTIAGDGTYGTSGDNGPASAAKLWGGQSLSFDLDGNLLVSQSGGSKIRKILLNTRARRLNPAHPNRVFVPRCRTQCHKSPVPFWSYYWSRCWY